MVDFNERCVSTILILTTVGARLHRWIELALRARQMRQSCSITVAMAHIGHIISSHSALAVLLADQVISVGDRCRVLFNCAKSSLSIFQPIQSQISELLRVPERSLVNHLSCILIFEHVVVLAARFFLLIRLLVR